MNLSRAMQHVISHAARTQVMAPTASVQIMRCRQCLFKHATMKRTLVACTSPHYDSSARDIDFSDPHISQSGVKPEGSGLRTRQAPRQTSMEVGNSWHPP